MPRRGGEAGDDTLTGGTGADTISGGLGEDNIFVAHEDVATGGDGDDIFTVTDLGEAAGGTITIDGGETGETLGDTLRLGGLADMSTLSTVPDTSGNGLTGSVTLLDGTIVNFSNIETIICFTPDTRILTEHGEKPIQFLRAGDRIVTRDNGLQPIKWLGSRRVEGTGDFAPIRVNPGFQSGCNRPLLVSPQHRILLSHHRLELMFGESEVLSAATHLVDGRHVIRAPQKEVTYIHLMLEQHEVIYAEGLATESFHASDMGLAALSDICRERMFDVFPHLRADISLHGPTARRTLKAHEARLLLGGDRSGVKAA